MLEVEAQAIGRDERSRLLDVRARAPGAAPRAAGASRCDCAASRRASRSSTAAVTMSRGLNEPPETVTRCARGPFGARRDEPGDLRRRAGRLVHDDAAVGHLSARLDVERRPLEHDEAGLAVLELRRLPPLGVEHRDAPGCR